MSLVVLWNAHAKYLFSDFCRLLLALTSQKLIRSQSVPSPLPHNKHQLRAKVSLTMTSKLLDTLNQQVIPPVFLIFFTAIVPLIVQFGNPSSSLTLQSVTGNTFAWTFIACIVVWALIWLRLSHKKFRGPPTPFGHYPVYEANGEAYYVGSLAALGLVLYLDPSIAILIYENHGPILGGLNVLGLALCTYLLLKAKLKNEEEDPYLRNMNFPLGYEFYRGMELQPRLLDVNVKQLTNCRIGLMLWQGLVITDLVASVQLNGISPGHVVSALLQTIYLYKFYHWETGYFNTLDITLDRAGYFICWGCLVWVPCLYTFHSFYFVAHPPQMDYISACVLAFVGLIAIYLNYEVDRQKELFRTKKSTKLQVWGKDVEWVKASYRLSNGELKESNLLVSGWWGIARKINYTFELVAAYCWCGGAGFVYGVWPFMYAIFLTVLLIHRIYRDEEKCAKKYGKAWNDYCARVPYRLIPYVY